MRKILFVLTVNPSDEKKYYFPPLGPAYLAGYLKKEFKEEFEFKIINKDFEKELNLFSPEIVGISSMTQNYNIALKYAKIAKSKGCKVITGGFHISTLPESLSEDMDAGVIGEGEETFKEIIKIYLENRDFSPSLLKNVKGVVFRERKEIKITEKREPISLLDNIPHPERSLIDDRKNCLIFSSRGCFYNCIYCPAKNFWKLTRFFSAEYIAEEIKEVVKRGIKFLNFADYLLPYDRKRLRKIVEILEEEKILKNCYFSVCSVSSLIDEEVVELFKKMNVISVSMNLVSANEDVLRSLNVPHSAEKNREIIKLLKKNNISIYASFTIGLPQEKKKHIEETLKFIKQTKLENFDVYLPVAYPATLFWEVTINKKIPLNKIDWDSFNCDFSTNYGKILIISENFSREELYRLYQKFLRYKKFLKIKNLINTSRNFFKKIYNKLRERRGKL